MKNVTLVAHSPNSGGAARMLSHLAKGLSRSTRVKPSIILSADDRPGFDLASSDVSVRYGPPGNAYITRRSPDFPDFAKRALDNAKCYADIYCRSRADVVLINTLTNYDAAIGAQLMNLPYLVWAHGIVGASINQFDKLRALIDSSILRNAAAVVCCSHWTQGYFLGESDATNVTTITNWTDVPYHLGEHTKAAPYRLSVLCSLEDHKGVDTAIWAMALLKQGRVNVRLDIYGDGPKRKELETLVRNLRVGDSVRFLGKTDDTLSVYRSSIATLVPSTIESFGMTAIESMAAGTLVIASRAGGLTDVVIDGETGLLFNTKDASDLAQKITLAVTNPALVSRITNTARESAIANFDGRKSIPQFENLLVDAAVSFRGYNRTNGYGLDLEYLRIAAQASSTPSDAQIREHAKNLERELADLRSSTSWRFSAPIRAAGRLVRRTHRNKAQLG